MEVSFAVLDAREGMEQQTNKQAGAELGQAQP